MTATFLIGYPDIPFRASTISLSAGSASSSYPLTNLVTGPRSERFQLSAADNTPAVRFDMGAGNTATIDYCFIARANLLKAAGATNASVWRSSDNITYVLKLGLQTALQTATFSGPRAEDLLMTYGVNDLVSFTAPSGAYRYWEFMFGDTVTSAAWSFSKVFLGSWFDFGRDGPIRDSVNITTEIDPGNREPRYVYNMRFDGVNNSVTSSFQSKIYNYKDVHSFVLYNRDANPPSTFQTLHCTLRSGKIVPLANDSNSIQVEFVELI